MPTPESGSAGAGGVEGGVRSTDRSSVADLAAAALSHLDRGDVEGVRELLREIAARASDSGRGVA